jgi:hypothetical protein
MLKPNDPAFDALLEDLRSVASSRYVEDPSSITGPPSGPYFRRSETGLRFEELKPDDQLDLLNVSVDWDHYKDQGLSAAQAGIIFSNFRDGKPREKWLDGIFDEAVVERDKLEGFKASVEDSKNSPSNHYFEEMDGDRHPWAELSAAAKLQYVALDAVRHDVPFESFAEVVKETIGDLGEAALRVVLEGQKELHAIARLFPDDGRTEPTPLVEQVKEMMDYASALETQEKERRQGREKLFEGISDVLDGKPPQAWAEAAKAFRDILRGGDRRPEAAQTQERGGREIC